MDNVLLKRIRQALRENNIDAWIIASSEATPDPHSFWLMNQKLKFRHFVIVPANKTPFVVLSSLDANCFFGKKKIYKTRDEFQKIFSDLGYKKVALNYSRKGITGLFHNDYLLIKRNLKAKIVPADFLEKIRSVKTKKQIEDTKKAVKITLDALAKVPRLIKKQKTEGSLRDALDKLLINPAFETIVASGKNSSNPHHIPSDCRITKGALLIDLGARVNSSRADISRTYSVGTPSLKLASDYKLVSNALHAAVSKMQIHNRASKAVNQIPFKMIHALGHSIGLDVHDVGFNFHSRGQKFETNQTLAVEPAVYRRDYGVRIEEDVLITKNGPLMLSKAPPIIPKLKL